MWSHSSIPHRQFPALSISPVHTHTAHPSKQASCHFTEESRGHCFFTATHHSGSFPTCILDSSPQCSHLQLKSWPFFQPNFASICTSFSHLKKFYPFLNSASLPNISLFLPHFPQFQRAWLWWEQELALLPCLLNPLGSSFWLTGWFGALSSLQPPVGLAVVILGG